MGKKSGPSIKDIAREGDEFKKKVDKFIKESEKVLSKPKATGYDEKVKTCHQRGVDMKLDIDDLLKRTEALTRADDSSKATTFDTKKEEEIKRMNGLKTRVDGVLQKLGPDDVEADYYRTLQDATEEASVTEGEADEDLDSLDEDGVAEGVEEAGVDEGEEYEDEASEYEDGEDDEEDEEEDEDDEDLEEEEEEEAEEEEDTGDDLSDLESELEVEYEAVCNRKAEKKEDLGFKKGDVFRLKCIRTDGWWECENSEGKTGLVPSNYMKEHNKYKAVQSAEAPKDEDNDEEPAEEDIKTPRGLQLWQSLRGALHETSATDVLHALGAVPSGFREASLAKLHKENEKYRAVNFLFPKLSPSNLFYKDLFYNPSADRVRNRNTRIQKIVTLMGCDQIPPPSSGVNVTQRLVRVCLFDGKNILSNIHTIRAQSSDREGRQWTFSTRVADSISSLDYGEFIFRSNVAPDTLAVLLEFTYMYTKTDSDKESEIACGWVKVPLFSEDGAMILNKQYTYRLNGGTPWEKGIEVDPTISRRATSKLKALISKNRQPYLTLKITAATKEQKEVLNTLPDVFVSNKLFMNHISLYRHVLADALLRDKMDIQSTELLHCPFLVNFPVVLDVPDLMDILRSALLDRMRKSRKSEKFTFMKTSVDPRDIDTMKELILAVFNEWIYPYMHLASLPKYEFGDSAAEEARKTELDRCIKMSDDPQSSLRSLLSSDVTHRPFDMSEVSYNIVSPLSLISTA